MIMYGITKTMEISASHFLSLPYDSPCMRMHGHNYKITISIRGEQLDENGMLCDFSTISEAIKSTFDHQLLNQIFEKNGWHGNPTAEVLAERIAYCISLILSKKTQELKPYVQSVTIMETDGNEATWFSNEGQAT